MWKVMLADDEKSIRTALGTLIDWQSLDCEVVYMARSGQDVLDHIGQYRPDLLITDIRMPGVDGVELANRLSGSELPIPIIFLTAYTDFSYAQAAVRYSVADYIVKPNVLEELPQAIRRIQERFGMQRSSAGAYSRRCCARFWTTRSPSRSSRAPILRPMRS